MVTLPITTNDGVFVAFYSKDGLCQLNFPSRAGARPSGIHTTVTPQVLVWHRLTEAAVQAVLAGLPIPSLPPLDLSDGTDFQRRVWVVLQLIPVGKTESYGEIAHKLAADGAARAVGSACGANPIPLLIPCHRVLAANHKIGGFSGGLDWKLKLLEREGVILTLQEGRSQD